jgi:GNAT superfamily N-acetyltransferase
VEGTVPQVREDLLELAEEPGLWLPPEPKLRIERRDGFAFVVYGRNAWVHHLRLDDVGPAVEEVGALAAAAGVENVSWWIGELTRPRDAAERLRALGLEPDDPPEETSLTLAEPPRGEPVLPVRRAESYDEMLQALELDWTVFGVPEEEQATRRVETRAAYDDLEASGLVSCYVADLDGKPVAFGRVVFTPRGGILMGGATLPEARGRGAYTSLVHARWRAAVERGTPRLTVSAGPESTPILLRLGFERIGAVKLLRQRID